MIAPLFNTRLSKKTGLSAIAKIRQRDWIVTSVLLWTTQLLLGCTGDTQVNEDGQLKVSRNWANEMRVPESDEAIVLVNRVYSDPGTDASEALAKLLQRFPDGYDVFPIVAEKLTSSDYGAVRTSLWICEWYGEKSIPLLMGLLEKRERVKLQDTADLIYPGATMYYGHGYIVPYDIDHLGVRAGWILEIITFREFGFRQFDIDEDSLPQVSTTVRRDVRLRDVVAIPEITSDFYVSEAVERATKWWEKNKGKWTRFTGVIEALKSDSERRQELALIWIRTGDSPCSALTKESFSSQILPLTRNLAKTGKLRVNVQAQLLLDDKEQWWSKWKDPEFLSHKEAEKTAN